MKDNLKQKLNLETKERIEAVRKLEGFLLNPGRFSVLVLGMRGTGKTHWLQEIQKCYSTEKHLKGFVVINAALAKNSNQEYWNEKFQQADKELLVVEDVEKLSKDLNVITLFLDYMNQNIVVVRGCQDSVFDFQIQVWKFHVCRKWKFVFL